MFSRCFRRTRLLFCLYAFILSSCANNSARDESKRTESTGGKVSLDTAVSVPKENTNTTITPPTEGNQTMDTMGPVTATPTKPISGSRPINPPDRTIASSRESGSELGGGSGIGRGSAGSSRPTGTRSGRGPRAAIQPPRSVSGREYTIARDTTTQMPEAMPGLDTATLVGAGTLQKDSMALSTLAYSYFDSIAENETKYIWAKIKSNSTEQETVTLLKEHIQHVMAQPPKASDTNSIKAIFIKGYKFVTITADTSPDFDITLLDGPAKQELDIVDGNNWRWGVRLKKGVTSPRSSITLRIKATNNVNGLKDYEDQQVIMIDVNIKQPENAAANTQPATHKSRAGLFIGLIIALILLVVILLFRKKLARLTGIRKKPQVFFSYAWGQEREQFVDKLYDSLKADGYPVIRDKVSLGYKGVISKFMTSIGKGQFIVVAISDKYLTSEYCMFELFEIFRNAKMEKEELVKRIYPVCIENLNLHSPAVISRYLQFWENKEQEWEQLIKDNTGSISEEQQADYTRVKRIIAYLGALLDFLADVNFLDQEQLSADNFQQIKTAIENRIAEDV